MTLTLLDNRYQLIRELNSGGFGETFLAEDTHMPSGRKCVIKQLKPIQNEPQVYQLVQDRFKREAAILEDLGNGNSQIPSLYAYFESAGQFYLVQEWIQGETLAGKVQQQGLLSESYVKQILIDILPVLDYVHSKKIIHRDIKPDNIILRQQDGKPILIDFGAVKETMGTVVNSTGSTSRSIVIGTPGFMPSEQSAGRPVYATDLYSLGLTAIYLLTGKLPQELETDYHTGELLWRDRALNVSPTLAVILDKTIQSHPRDRFSSATEMLQALHSNTIINPQQHQHSPPNNGYYQPTQISPPPVSPAYHTPTVVSPPPPVQGYYQQPVTPPTNAGMADWKKAVIIGGVVGAAVLIGLVATRPQTTSTSSNSTSNSTVQSGNANSPNSSQPIPATASISKNQAVDTINRWIQAKRELFAPPYNRELGAQITTGKAYRDNIGSGSSLEWLQNNNAYYAYGVQRLDSVENFEANGNEGIIEVIVTEERTLYKNGKIDRENTSLDTRRVRYTLQSENGQAKIADYKTIEILRKS